MKFRDILAIAASGEDSDSIVALARQVADQNDGRVSGLLVSWTPPLLMADGWIATPVWADPEQEVRARLDEQLARLRASFSRSTGQTGAIDGELLAVGQPATCVATRARHYDLSVLGCPRTDAEQQLIEAALFDSGRPLLLAPAGWTPRPIGRTIVVCWKPTREASRAIAEAEAFLAGAHRIVLLTVDTSRDASDCQSAGNAIADHFTRCGRSVQTCAIAPVARSEARSVLDHAEAIGADLIVMGGYGRSRVSELIFGGMTRDMLREASIPVLMAN